MTLPASCGRFGYDPAATPSKGGKDASIVVVDSGLGGGDSGGAGGAGTGAVTGSAGGAGAGGVTASSGGTESAATGFDAASDAGAGGAAHDASSTDATDGAPRCRLAPQPLADWCTEVPELPAAAVIDGEVECGLEVRRVTPVAYNLTSTPDSTIDYAIAWSADGLYLYARVIDPVVLPAPAADPPWEGDSVEFYVDGDGTYAAPPAYDADTRQLIIAAPQGSTPSTRAETYAVPPTGVAWTSTKFGAFLRSDGYVVEALLTASDLGLTTWLLEAGRHVGFDVGLNVSAATPDGGTQGTRIGQYFLRVDTALTAGHPFQSVTAFCNPVLVARP